MRPVSTFYDIQLSNSRAMYPKARIQVDKIDPLVKANRNLLKFRPGAQPAFVVNTSRISKKDLLFTLKDMISQIKHLRY